MDNIFSELHTLNASLSDNATECLCKDILNCSGTVVGLGAGRMGYSLQAFIMRLSHLGFSSYMIGDTTTPRIGSGDLLLVNSSSGETQSIMLLARLGKTHGAKVFGITSGKNSTLSNLSDSCIFYNTIESCQLMKTAYEQFTYLFFDNCAEKLANRVKLTVNEIENNHSILE